MKMRRDRSWAITSVVALLGAMALLAGTPAAGAGCKFPATGQMTCWDSSGNGIDCAGTGQDGDIQAGKPLRYKDNGDGTITDKVTGLMWEKKDDNNTDPLHDMDTTYTWDNAFAGHVAGLNTAHFAGHTDWRLPNMKELQSIVDWEMVTPAVDPVFDTDCAASCTVLICSCTPASSGYWSSSTDAGTPTFAFGVGFNFGSVLNPGKGSSLFVRAVRGGCL